MAMKQVMSKEKALELATKLSTAFGKFGAQISVPYTTAQLLEVIAVLHANGNYDAPTQEELTLAKRQLTACKAREAGLRKKTVEPAHLTNDELRAAAEELLSNSDLDDGA